MYGMLVGLVAARRYGLVHMCEYTYLVIVRMHAGGRSIDRSMHVQTNYKYLFYPCVRACIHGLLAS